MIPNTLRLVSSEAIISPYTKSWAIENVHRHFRVNYQNWYSVDLEEIRRGNKSWRKDQMAVWLLALENHSVDMISAVLDLIMQGKTIFSRTEPTPAQYAELCDELHYKQSCNTKSLSNPDDILDRF